MSRNYEPVYIYKEPGFKPGSLSFDLTCFFLRIRFLLCGAFLFGRFILFGFSVFFRHTITFKVSECYVGCRIFLPFIPCCPLSKGNSSVSI